MTLFRRTSKRFCWTRQTEPSRNGVVADCIESRQGQDCANTFCPLSAQTRGNTEMRSMILFPLLLYVGDSCAPPRVCDPDEQTRILASLSSKEVTEKTLAAGLSAAVNQHDAEAAKEESATGGRGTHVREVNARGCNHDASLEASSCLMLVGRSMQTGIIVSVPLCCPADLCAAVLLAIEKASIDCVIFSVAW